VKKEVWAIIGILVVSGAVAFFKVRELFKNLSFQITSFGTPQLKSDQIIFPIHLEFDNQSPTSLTIDDIANDIYLARNGAWVMLGTSAPRMTPIVIAARQISKVTIYPLLKASLIWQEMGNSIITSLVTMKFNDLFANKFKIDTRVIIKGIEVARDEKIIGQTVPVSGLAHWL
jgi:hypothetical protein